jgi:hypothetical protein
MHGTPLLTWSLSWTKFSLTLGGIPLIIAFHHNYQLSLVELDMLYCCDIEPNKTSTTAMGQRPFCELAQNVMELDSSKREHKDQTYFKEHLRKLHQEEQSPQLTEKEAKFLSKFFVNDTPNFLDKERMMLEDYENTLFLFVNPIPMENKQQQKSLRRQHSKDNPDAIIKPLIAASTGRQVAQTKHFQGNNIPAHNQSLHRS